jgi:hypothetical protein
VLQQPFIFAAQYQIVAHLSIGNQGKKRWEMKDQGCSIINSSRASVSWNHNKQRRQHADPSKTRGQAIVEFALAVPFIFMLTFGVIEFGRLMFSYSIIVTAAREAARYGSAVENYQDCTGIQNAAVRVGGMAGVEASHVQIAYDDGFGGSSRSCPPGQLSLGSRIIVEVRDVPYTPLVPAANLPSMSLRSESRRTILIGLELR